MLTIKKKAAITAGLVLSLASFGSKSSQAATLAFSETKVNISNFNYTSPTASNLLPIASVKANPGTFTLAKNGVVDADAKGMANVDVDDSSVLPKVKGATNFSFGITQGVGNNYFGYAESSALAQIENLEIAQNTTFSFEFDALLTLVTSIDSLEREQASAEGNIYLEVFNQTNGNVLDFLLLKGKLTSIGSDLFDYDKSSNINFDTSNKFAASYGEKETEEIVTAVVKGKYSRSFNRNIVLGIREAKSNKVSVEVPEPFSFAGIAVAALMGLWMKRKQKLEHN
jgi:hypothetical protein